MGITLPARLNEFVVIFISIFLQSLPFLLLGIFASALVQRYLSDEAVTRWMPRRTVPAVLLGSVFGFVAPVCDCGVIPLARRLMTKGVPVYAATTLIVAAPVINPIVLLSTAFADEMGEVPDDPLAALPLIAWRIRDLSRPRSEVLLSDMPTCANCHSFTPDGKTLAMDLDGPQGDKGAYAIAPIAPVTTSLSTVAAIVNVPGNGAAARSFPRKTGATTFPANRAPSRARSHADAASNRGSGSPASTT